ncbi:hypothetical protein BLOT_008918 [Blomia tropicalis]|nr:hypothetical protein BLOT_008918 [Blomia tropicalis]
MTRSVRYDKNHAVKCTEDVQCTPVSIRLFDSIFNINIKDVNIAICGREEFYHLNTHEFMNDIMWQEKMDDPIGTQIDISMPLRSIGAELIDKKVGKNIFDDDDDGDCHWQRVCNANQADDRMTPDLTDWSK